MRAAFTLLTVLLLNACGPVAPEPASAPAVAPVDKPDPNGWAFAIGKNSVELAWITDAGAEASPLRLICARDDGFMVIAAALKPIASEERLSIGAGQEVVALVAVADRNRRGPLVRATGPADDALFDALNSGEAISVSYGAQHYGPLVAPGPAVRRAFTETCRKLNSGTHV